MGLLKWLKGTPEPNGRVYMTHSVGEYVGGESYDLPLTLADEYIVKGYATGDLSREWSEDEKHSVKYLNQSVGI